VTISRRNLIAAASTSLLASSAVGSSVSDLEAAKSGLRLLPGAYAITRNTVIRVDVALDPGASFSIAAGATLKFLGHFAAPIGQVFTGPGRVDLSEGRTLEAYPEWWGARPESGQDCIAAMDACLAAHPIMRLGPHSYFVSRTLVVERHNRHIVGSVQRWLGPHTGTRIVLTGTGDVMRIGYLRRPGIINDFLQGVMVSDLQLTRDKPATGTGHGAPAGLRIRHALYADICRVWSTESINGFAIGGAVRTYLRDCSAFRSLRGGTPIFRGFACDGSTEIGAAGGNASLYLVDCNASTGGEPPLDECVGLLLDGAFADTYAANFETSGIAVGMRLSGQAGTLSRAKQRSGHANVRIIAPVLDQCTDVGIDVRDTSEYALLDFSDSYVASAPGARAAMRFENVRGQTTVRGGQCIGWTSESAAGIIANNSEGLDFEGLKLLQFRTPTRMTNCRDLSVGLSINQPEGKSNLPAIILTNCEDALVKVRIKGSPSAFSSGIAVTGTRTHSVNIISSAIRESTVGGVDRRVITSDTPSNAVRIS
jgi:hypothetical protein